MDLQPLEGLGVEQLRADRAETLRRRDSALAEVENLIARRALDPDNDGIDNRLGDFNIAVSRLDDRLVDIDGRIARHETMLRRAADPSRLIPGDGSVPFGAGEIRRDVHAGPHAIARAQALRAIERLDLSPAAGDRLSHLVERDTLGHDARYIAAVSSPAYVTAFARMLARPESAHFEMTPEEASAVREAADAKVARDMAVGSQTDGGYAVPAVLDPTFRLTSDGALNPMRGLANVVTITAAEWQAITTDGVTATFGAEGSETIAQSPTLARPSIIPERLMIFVPVSFEAFGDIPNLLGELSRLFSDAKDTKEASRFLYGTGHGQHEPTGLVYALDVGDTSIVKTGTANAFHADDVYDLAEALPPRFQPRAQWLSSMTVRNAVYRMSSPGGDEPPLIENGQMLGKPWNEASELSSLTTVGGENILVYGSLRDAYTVVDRVGLSVEIAPHLFNSSGRPTGKRGVIAWARVGGGVVNAEAARILQVKAT